MLLHRHHPLTKWWNKTNMKKICYKSTVYLVFKFESISQWLDFYIYAVSSETKYILWSFAQNITDNYLTNKTNYGKTSLHQTYIFNRTTTKLLQQQWALEQWQKRWQTLKAKKIWLRFLKNISGEIRKIELNGN